MRTREMTIVDCGNERADIGMGLQRSQSAWKRTNVSVERIMQANRSATVGGHVEARQQHEPSQAKSCRKEKRAADMRVGRRV